MNLMTGEPSDAFFGGEVPDGVRALLHQAATAPATERAALLWTAQALAPEVLAVYYALYKHHAGQRQFQQAEDAARRGLAEAARQAGIGPDGRLLGSGAAADFLRDGPARFWLFTTKALAFISLRSGRPEQAAQWLQRIEQLCPEARLGDEVTARLLAAARGAGTPAAEAGQPGGPG